MPRNEQVTIILDGKSAKLVQAWQQARAAAQQFEDGMRDAAAASQSTASKADDQWKKVSKQIRNTALQVVGLNTALSTAQTFMQAIGREFREFQQTRSSQAERDVSAGAALAKAIGAFTPSKELTLEQLPNRLRQTSNRTQLPFSMVADAATGMFSGAGSFSNEEALQSFELAARLNPDLVIRQETEQLQDIARAQLSIARASNLSIHEAGGVGKRFFKAASVTQSGEFAKNVAPALIAMSQMSTSKDGRKDDVEFLMEILSSFTVLAGDDTGKRSSTNAAIAFANLAQFMASEGEFGTLEELTEKLRGTEDLRKRFGGFLTTLPNEELARKGKKIFGDDFEVQGLIGGEARTRSIAAGIFRPGSQFDEERIKAREKLLAGGQLRDATAQELEIADNVRRMPEFTSAQIHARQRNLREQGTIFDPVSAAVHAAQESSETRKQFGQMSIANMVQTEVDKIMSAMSAQSMDDVKFQELMRLSETNLQLEQNRGNALGNFAGFMIPGLRSGLPFLQAASQQRIDLVGDAAKDAGADVGLDEERVDRFMRMMVDPNVALQVEVKNLPVQPPQMPDGGF